MDPDRSDQSEYRHGKRWEGGLEHSLKLLSGANDQTVINVIQVQVLGEIEAITELWLN